MDVASVVKGAIISLGIDRVYTGYVDTKVGFPVVIVDTGRTRPHDIPGVADNTVSVSIVGYASDTNVDIIAEKVKKLHNKRIKCDDWSVVLVLSTIDSSYMVSGADVIKVKRVDFTVYSVAREVI